MTFPVKLPKEVLNLFPTWEYRCPECSTYVESNISFCPNCKTAFNEKRWRVPPRFLKSHKTLSEYAHKVLAPKLTQKQRELLFKYFTELFSDGFESGDLSEWTGTSGSPSVVGSPVYSGNYSMEFGRYDYAYKTISNQTTIYTRAYFRMSSLPSGTDQQVHFMRLLDGGTALILVMVVGSNTLRMRNGFDSTNSDFSFSWSADTWYCIEAYFLCDANGESKVYIDGSEEASRTGFNSSAYACDTVEIGNINGNVAITSYVDSVVVADTYIGQEGTGQTYTKTWATDTLFKKLDITETLSIDAALQKQDIPKTFSLDAALQKSLLIQNQIDALFKRFDIPKSFAVDAHFGALITQIVSRQIDVLLKKRDATKTFGLDAYFGPAEAETYMRDFALDALFAYKVRLPELWLDENGKLVLNISRPYTWVGT